MPTRKTLDERVAGTQFEFPRHPRVEPLRVESVLRKLPPAEYCVRASVTVQEAMRRMAEHDLGALLVVQEDGRVCGIFSEHEYARGAAGAADVRRVGELMSSGAATAAPGDAAEDCLRRMIENQLRYIPVLEAGKPVAILSRDALLQEMVGYLERVFREHELDRQIVSLRGTYSC